MEPFRWSSRSLQTPKFASSQFQTLWLMNAKMTTLPNGVIFCLILVKLGTWGEVDEWCTKVIFFVNNVKVKVTGVRTLSYMAPARWTGEQKRMVVPILCGTLPSAQRSRHLRMLSGKFWLGIRDSTAIEHQLHILKFQSELARLTVVSVLHLLLPHDQFLDSRLGRVGDGTHINIREFRSPRSKWTPCVDAKRVVFPYLMEPRPEKFAGETA